jgi:hypothetical protein
VSALAPHRIDTHEQAWDAAWQKAGVDKQDPQIHPHEQQEVK